MSQITLLIDAAAAGDRQAAADLLPLVYAELRKLAAARMAAENPGHTLNPTALVHEAYLRLVGDQHFDGRAHFFAAAAEAMRRILVNHARDRNRLKRAEGGYGSSCSTRWGPWPKIPTSSCRWTNCSPDSARKTTAAAGRSPPPFRRALRPGGGRGAGALPGRRVPELEIRSGLAPRGLGKIISLVFERPAVNSPHIPSRGLSLWRTSSSTSAGTVAMCSLPLSCQSALLT